MPHFCAVSGHERIPFSVPEIAVDFRLKPTGRAFHKDALDSVTAREHLEKRLDFFLRFIAPVGGLEMNHEGGLTGGRSKVELLNGPEFGGNLKTRKGRLRRDRDFPGVGGRRSGKKVRKKESGSRRCRNPPVF